MSFDPAKLDLPSEGRQIADLAEDHLSMAEVQTLRQTAPSQAWSLITSYVEREYDEVGKDVTQEEEEFYECLEHDNNIRPSATALLSHMYLAPPFGGPGTEDDIPVALVPKGEGKGGQRGHARRGLSLIHI